MAPMAPSEFFCHKCGVRLPCYQHNPIEPVEPEDAAARSPRSAVLDAPHPEAGPERPPRKVAEAS